MYVLCFWPSSNLNYICFNLSGPPQQQCYHPLREPWGFHKTYQGKMPDGVYSKVWGILAYLLSGNRSNIIIIFSTQPSMPQSDLNIIIKPTNSPSEFREKSGFKDTFLYLRYGEIHKASDYAESWQILIDSPYFLKFTGNTTMK